MHVLDHYARVVDAEVIVRIVPERPYTQSHQLISYLLRAGLGYAQHRYDRVVQLTELLYLIGVPYGYIAHSFACESWV